MFIVSLCEPPQKNQHPGVEWEKYDSKFSSPYAIMGFVHDVSYEWAHEFLYREDGGKFLAASRFDEKAAISIAGKSALGCHKFVMADELLSKMKFFEFVAFHNQYLWWALCLDFVPAMELQAAFGKILHFDIYPVILVCEFYFFGGLFA